VFTEAACRIWEAFRAPTTAGQALEGFVHRDASLQCVNRMLERGILSSSPDDAPRAEPQRSSPSGKLADVYLHVTNRCNLRCLYCYNQAYRCEADEQPELSTAELLNLLEQLPGLGTEGVIFTGGEPLLRTDCLEVAQAARRQGLATTLLTNGTALGKLAARTAAVFDDVIVSLDSCVAAEQEYIRPGGSFRQIAQGIRALVDAGACRVRLRPVITRYNVANLPEFPAFAASVLGCTDFMLALFTPGDLATDLLPDPLVYRRALRDFRQALAAVNGTSTMDRDELAESPAGCGASASLLSIAPNGDVFPCQCLHFPELAAGNIRRLPLADIWRQAARREVPEPFEACRRCWAGGLCHLRCQALYHAFGELEDRFTRLVCPFALLEVEDSLWAQAASASGAIPRKTVTPGPPSATSNETPCAPAWPPSRPTGNGPGNFSRVPKCNH